MSVNTAVPTEEQAHTRYKRSRALDGLTDGFVKPLRPQPSTE